MAFNSNTYHRNRCRREAEENMARARDIKARVSAGTAYDWEAPRIAHFAKLAVISARMSRNFEALRRLGKR